MRRLTCLAAAIAVAAAVSPAQAAPTGPSCGDTIARDTTLTADLVGCPGDGLVIGADGVTLNLNGHTLAGEASPGIGVRNRHHRVVVEGGTVRGFYRAVEFTGARLGIIRDLTAVHNANRAIVLADGSDDNVVEHNNASSNGRSGIVLIASQGNLVSHNRTVDNALTGIGGLDAAHNRVLANVVADNHDNGIFWDGGSGNRIEGNRVSDSPFQGMALNLDDGLIAGNHLVHTGDALALTGSGNRVTRNVVSDVGGCPDGCGYGLSLEGGAHNEITDNVVARTTRDGIRVDAFVPEDAPLTSDTLIRGNVVRDAGVDGISVGTETPNPIRGTTITANTILRSRDDGIDIERSETVLSDNHAIRNGDFGIEAIPGVTDAGGNRAAANGNAAQCLEVRCSAGGR
jgi:parallel beta-helix repeat protein